jgi:FSR family fosmidomycin resistance protein-like MFS transporter
VSTSAISLGASEAGRAKIDYARVGLLSFGHATNDMYGNLITALMPYLVIQGKITATLAGLVLLVYLIGSSVLQPFFGHISDSSGRRWFVVLGPLWIGVAASLVGWVGNAGLLFALAGIGGIGTAAFHPQAASMVDRVSPKNKGWSMSIFSMGGNIGFALGPVVAAVISLIGLHWTPVVILPGLVLTVLLALHAPRLGRRRVTTTKLNIRRIAEGSWGALALIVSVIATRSAVQYALIIFLPLYFHARGSSAELGSYYAFVLSMAGALGGLAGGRLSDRYGRKVVVVSSLVATAPLLVLSLLIQGPLVWGLLALSGALLLASNSVTVVQGQELMPANTGIASGLTMGLGFGLSGIFASALTALSDHIGVHATIFLVPALALVAALLAAFVPSRSLPATG